MSIDGTWNLTLNGPQGPQSLTLTLETEGAGFTGTLFSPLLGTNLDVTDGALEGSKATWKSQMTSPIALALGFTAEFDGDKVRGDATAGNMGEFPFEGTRA